MFLVLKLIGYCTHSAGLANQGPVFWLLVFMDLQLQGLQPTVINEKCIDYFFYLWLSLNCERQIVERAHHILTEPLVMCSNVPSYSTNTPNSKT